MEQETFLLFTLTTFFMLCLLLVGVVFRKFRKRRVEQKRTHTKNPIIVDGSNVMHWDRGEPRIQTVQKVIAELKAQGYTAGVVFDANAGYLLSGSYQHDGSLGRELGLPADRVMVVPKGTPADPAILEAARDMQARIVTNDRFRDWANQYPEVRRKGHLIRGSYVSGHLKLQLSKAPNPDAARTFQFHFPIA